MGNVVASIAGPVLGSLLNRPKKPKKAPKPPPPVSQEDPNSQQRAAMRRARPSSRAKARQTSYDPGSRLG